jgi:ATP-dependent Clp protease ATP-binding subunit ClpC
MDSGDLSTILLRFTPRARRVLGYAREDAVRRGAAVIGTLHIICGLAREGHGLLARVFAASQLSLTTLCEELGGTPYPGVPHVNVQELELDVELDRVIRFAAEEAHNFGRDQVGTEHLLLGMLRASDSEAGKFLTARGMSLEATRRQLTAFASHPTRSSSA